MDEIRQAAASVDLPSNVSAVDIDDVWCSVDFIEAWDNSRGGGMARQAFWRGETQEALTNVEMALVRSDLLTSTERSMLSSLRARALARLGRRQETLRTLGIADEEFTSSQPEGDPQFILYYDAAEHRGPHRETSAVEHLTAEIRSTGDGGQRAGSRRRTVPPPSRSCGSP